MADVIETVFRFKADAAALRSLAEDVDRLHKATVKAQTEGLDRLAAKMSPFMAGAALGGAVLGWFAASTAAVTAYTSAMVGLTTTAAKSADELRKLGLVTEEQAEQAKRAGASVDALDTTWQLFTFTLAQDVSPTVASVSRLLVAAGLAASEMAAKVHAGRVLLQSGAVAVGGIVGGGMGAQTVGGLLWTGGAALSAAEGAMAGYVDQAEQLIRSLAKQSDGHEKAARAAKEQTAALKALTPELIRAANAGNSGLTPAAILGANGGNIGALSGGAGTAAFNAGLQSSASSALLGAGSANQSATSGRDGLNEAVKAHRATASEIVGIWTSAATSIMSAMGGLFEGNARAQKSWALVSIAVNTAVAIMQAFATYGPTPVGFAMAASMTAVGALQFAAAAAGKPPGGGGGRVSFGGGGGISQSASQFFTPSPQGGETRGGSNRGRGGGEITIQTIEGYAPARDLIEALNRKGAKLRLRGA